MLAITGDTPDDPDRTRESGPRDRGLPPGIPKVETPEVDLDGVELDPPTMADQLASGADDLDGVLVDVNQAEKQADVTRQAKNEAITFYDRKFLRVARSAEPCSTSPACTSWPIGCGRPPVVRAAWPTRIRRIPGRPRGASRRRRGAGHRGTGRREPATGTPAAENRPPGNRTRALRTTEG